MHLSLVKIAAYLIYFERVRIVGMTNKDVVCVVTRIEVARRLKVAYAKSSKSEKRENLDRFMEITGLSRPSVRRYMTDPNLGVRNVFKMDRRAS